MSNLSTTVSSSFPWWAILIIVIGCVVLGLSAVFGIGIWTKHRKNVNQANATQEAEKFNKDQLERELTY